MQDKATCARSKVRLKLIEAQYLWPASRSVRRRPLVVIVKLMERLWGGTDRHHTSTRDHTGWMETFRCFLPSCGTLVLPSTLNCRTDC